MTRNEYDEHQQRLDEQLRAGMELLQAAHRQQVRALDLLWAAGAGEEVPIRRTEEKPSAGKLPAPSPRPARARRRAGELYEEVRALLPQVPEVFDRNHVCDVLGCAPDRTSLLRVFEELAEEGILSVEQRGTGRDPTRYRKRSASVRETQG
jgi:hypothetical protein